MEHRQSSTISVVVTDIVGSTSLAERLGPDRYDALRREHFATVRRAVAATRRHRDQEHGRRPPRRLRQRTRRALDGAIALQRGVDAAARTGGESVTIRVGVAAGDAFVEDGDYFGIPVVEAARLCTAARGGQILDHHAHPDARRPDGPSPLARRRARVEGPERAGRGVGGGVGGGRRRPRRAAARPAGPARPLRLRRARARADPAPGHARGGDRRRGPPGDAVRRARHRQDQPRGRGGPHRRGAAGDRALRALRRGRRPPLPTVRGVLRPPRHPRPPGAARRPRRAARWRPPQPPRRLAGPPAGAAGPGRSRPRRRARRAVRRRRRPPRPRQRVRADRRSSSTTCTGPTVRRCCCCATSCSASTAPACCC